ncbi:MAG: hypothetical protein GT601_18065, partial [Acidaminobacter sp.]|nr:hypothetical protein [Acidaminobacter sp.]
TEAFHGESERSASLEAAARKAHNAEPGEAEAVGIRSLNTLEEEEIRRALLTYGKSKAGIEAMTERLGISRATLYRKFKTHNL